MTEREREFADAARVVDESAFMHVTERAAAFFLVERPFQGRSLVAAALKGPVRNWFALIVAGCLTHALLLQLMPDRIAPVKPLAYGMVVAFAAFAVVSGFITTRSNATATADSSAGTPNTRKS